MHKYGKIISVIALASLLLILFSKRVSGDSPNYIEVNSIDQFRKLEQEKRIVLCYSADWCEPCKPVKAALKDIAKQEKNIKILIIDIDKFPILAEEKKISLIPSVHVRKKFLQGRQAQETLHNFILKELQ